MDFTLSTYNSLLKTLQQTGYAFQPYAEFLTNPAERVVVLRHDVDKRPENSLVTAKIENELGIRGTYYFRLVPCSFNPEIIKEIHSLGHEIGYHYEDLSLVGKNHRSPNTDYRLPITDHRLPHSLAEKAILSFTSNLAKLRNHAPITTACMHGSPLSRYDNRLIWDYYNYHDYGIIGEPYFDTDFSKVLYLTDTGRTWNNSKISVRDKPPITEHRLPNTDYRLPITDYPCPMPHAVIRSTYNIIDAANQRTLPSQIMITVHPQRWTSNPLAWIQELIFQNLRNIVKRILVLKIKQ